MIKRISKRGGVFSAIDLKGYGLDQVPLERQASVKKQVGEFIVSRIKQTVQGVSSPVQGERWKSTLSKDYAKDKRSKGGGTAANLRLTGSMLNNLTHKTGKGAEVLVGTKNSSDRDGRSNVKKTIGHNHFERGSTAPRRRFLPAKGQKFNKEIESGIKSIVSANQVLDLQELGAEVLGTAETSTTIIDQAILLNMVEGQDISELI